MIYLIGGTGFVGSAYARLFTTRSLPFKNITRQNVQELRGTSCDLLINANGNSKKFLAGSHPLQEFDQSVRSVAESVEYFRCGTYVMLSSGDVYPDQSSPETTNESQFIDPARLSRYGLHKMLGEGLIRGTQSRWLVFRMGGFVGPGLRKNAIYDMLMGAPVRLSSKSELQFTSTDSAAQLVWEVIQKGVHGEIINLGALGLIQLDQLHRKLKSQSCFQENAPTIRYELSLKKLESLVDMPLPSSVGEVDDFITGEASKGFHTQ